MNKGTESSGSVLVAPMFLNTAAAASGKVKLSDIKMTSRDDGEYGDYYMQVLNSSGGDATFEDGEYAGMKKRFFWFDNEDTAAGWYDADGEILFDADSIEFQLGDALWILGGGQEIVTAGQVCQSQVTVGTVSAGSVGIGNPFATAIKLSNIYMISDSEGEYGDYYMQILNTSGGDATFEGGEYSGMKKRFFWFDNEDTAAGWYDADGAIPFDADSIEFAAGDGLWVLGGGRSLVFQVPDALK